MKIWIQTLIVSGALLTPVVVMAQGPGGRGNRAASPDAAVTRMMSFDRNRDGRLTSDEVTDARLRSLCEQADTNTDGAVTQEELSTLLAREGSTLQGGGPGGRGPGGPPQPGQILPGFIQQQLNLTDAQKQALTQLQQEVNGRLASILTPAQLQQLQSGQNRGPGGPGGANGFGPGGPGRQGSYGQGGPGGQGGYRPQGGPGGGQPGGFNQGGAGRSRGNRPPNTP